MITVLNNSTNKKKKNTLKLIYNGTIGNLMIANQAILPENIFQSNYSVKFTSIHDCNVNNDL